jgi:hypothetical protein
MNLLTRVDSFSSKREARRLIGRRVQQGQKCGTIKGIIVSRTGIRLSIAWDGGLTLSWVTPESVSLVARPGPGPAEDRGSLPVSKPRVSNPPHSFHHGNQGEILTYAGREH